MKLKALAFKSTIVVVLLVSILLTACSNSQTQNTSASSKKQGDSNKVLNLYVDMNWWPFKDWSGKIPEEITKETGIKVNVQVAADSNQLALNIASGNMPDLVFTYDHIADMTNAKVSYPWSDLIKKYTPDFKIDKTAIAVNTASDGKFYTIRNGFATQQQFQSNKYALVRGGGLVVREDIMKALGNPPLNNLNDLKNILGMVKQKYPDMIPLVMTPLQTDAYFRIQFGMPRFGFTLVNGQAKYYISDPGQLDYYKFMNDLYRNGYIQAENFTWKDTNQASNLSLAGKAFAQEYDVATAEQLNAQLQREGKNYRFMQVTKPLGAHPQLINNNPGWAGLFVPVKSKHPDLAMKLIQFLASEKGQRLAQWGIEGQDYKMSPDGGYPIFKYDTSDAAIQKKMGVSFWGLFADSGITEDIARYQPGKPSTKAMVNLRPYFHSDPGLGMIVPDANSDQKVIQSNLDNLIKTEETKIILATSEKACTEEYNNMMKQLNNMGLKKLEDWANKKYAENKAKLGE